MNDNDIGLRCGGIYKKLKEAKYTYIYCCEVRKFMSMLMQNSEIANEVLSRKEEISKILEDIDCGIIQQMKIDYNCIDGKDRVIRKLRKLTIKSTLILYS